MTLLQRLSQFFSRNIVPAGPPIVSAGPAAPVAEKLTIPAEGELSMTAPLYSQPADLSDWLLDEDSLRDEGVLFGLSDATPDPKLAQIRAAFARRSAHLDIQIEQYTEKMGELNRSIEQHENRLVQLRDQMTDGPNSQSTPHNLIRTVVSLCLSGVMSVGTFYLIDETLRPSFPNRWIAVGIFLAGMFNLFGRTSFFYETGSRLSGRRIIEETGLPLAASVFILTQSLQTQSVSAALGLFVFLFFVFLLAGKLLLSTLTALQQDLAIIHQSRRMEATYERSLPIWSEELEQLKREINAVQAQKWAVVTVLSHAQADLTGLNAHRDQLINLFLGEFDLARSLRERLTEQQRNLMINYHS